MKRKLTNILVTGGAGFIGSNFIHYMLHNEDFQGRIINIDKLTYAGNLENLKEIEKQFNDSRYFFIKGDICHKETIRRILSCYNIDTVFHFAAESHVDRSIDTSGGLLQEAKGTIISTFSLSYFHFFYLFQFPHKPVLAFEQIHPLR